MNSKNTIEQKLENLADALGPRDSFVNDVMIRIEDSPVQLGKKTQQNDVLRRILMKNTFKLTAAAIILVTLSAIFVFPTNPGSIALADVYSKVLQSQAYVYRVSMTMSGMGKMMGVEEMDDSTKANMTITISEEYGMMMENHITVDVPNGQKQNITQLAYLLPGENVMVSIMPEQKRYQRMEFTDDLLQQTKKQNNDPREMIKQMLDCDYVELEPIEIDGRMAQGFQTIDPAYMMGTADEIKATLWVDVETWMPVKSEIWGKISGMEISYTIDQFHWNVPVTAADFEYVIPDDYDDMGTMKMPEITEEGALEGLRAYKKLFGCYPEKIDMASLVPSLIKKMKELVEDPQTEAAKAFVEKMKAAEASGDQAVAQQAQHETMPISALGMFHMRLMQDKKDLAYYGDQVTPDDVDAVLMRWKADNGQYRVVFGDLTITEMPYEELKEIEPQPLKEESLTP